MFSQSLASKVSRFASENYSAFPDLIVRIARAFLSGGKHGRPYRSSEDDCISGLQAG